MTEQELSQYESFLLESPESVVQRTIKGTDNYYYFKYIQILSQQGIKLTDEQLNELQRYSQFTTEKALEIKLRHIFFKYDQYYSDGNKEGLKEVLDELLKYFFLDFDYAQPQNVSIQNVAPGLQFQVQSLLDDQFLSLDGVIEASYSDQSMLNSLAPEIVRKLSVEKLLSSPHEVIQAFLNLMLPYLPDIKDIPHLLLMYHSQRVQRQNYYELEPHFFQALTVTQMIRLGELYPPLYQQFTFVGELLVKEFNTYQQTSGDNRLEYLQNMLKWAQAQSNLFESLSRDIVYELLHVGMDKNQYDIELFLKYLQAPRQPFQLMVQPFPVFSQFDWSQYTRFDQGRWKASETLIQQFLENHFKNSSVTEIFLPFINKQYVFKTLYEVQLYQGKENLDIPEYFSGEQLKKMAGQKLITFLNENKGYFNHGEPVTLRVLLKNIPSLTVRVFELCTENYLLQNMKKIDNSINLEGLIPSEQAEYKYNEPPVVKTEREFSFDKIAKKPKGIFIVEFVGNGLTSRAIIRKGGLYLRERQTVAGLVFNILDENLETLSGEKTGIWIKKRFYKVNQNSEVIVPFVDNQIEQDVVIVHNDFADLAKVTLVPEVINFECGYLYSTEQMLMSSKAKILIKPFLKINNIPASLQLIKETSITVTTTNESDIPSTMNFDKVKFNENEESEIEFPIAAKLRVINISVSVKVDTLKSTQDKDQETLTTNSKTFSSNHTIVFKNYQGQRTFCSQFLKYTADKQYEVYLLGRNGEPKPGVNLQLTFRVKHYQPNKQTTLTTDADGKVSLGPLNHVTQLTSSVLQKGDIVADLQTFNLENNHRISYPDEQIILAVGETLRIPAPNDQEFSLRQTSKQTDRVIRDKQDNARIQDGDLVISGLDVGTYFLRYYDPNLSFQITVTQGQYWKNSRYLLTKEKLFENKAFAGRLQIKKVDQEQDEENFVLKPQIQTFDRQSTRVHVFAVQFLPHQNFDPQTQQLKDLFGRVLSKPINASKPQNSFYSNKRLSDEQKYVLDRKNQERYVGNTLEKPQILLKRQFIRDTYNNAETLQQEGAFEEQQLARRGSIDDVDIPSSRVQAKTSMASRNVSLMRCFKKAPASQIHQPTENYNVVNGFLNFLQNPALVQGNLRLDDTGSVQVKIPKNKYSSVIILVTNNQNAVYDVIPLESSPIKTRDLSQKSSMKSDKFYSIFRDTKQLEKGESAKFTDLTSTELQIVDSTQKLFSLLIELRKCHSQQDDEQEQGFKYWEFLKTWDTLDFDEKHKLFDKHQCDELNIFLFFKDRAYFETYVKGYIANKIELSFIDHFLLGNREHLIQWSEPATFSGINSLEQALLVIFLNELSTQPEDKQTARDLYQYLEAKIKLEQMDQKTYKRLFDTILDAKTSGQNTTAKQEMLGIQQSFHPPPSQAYQPAPMMYGQAYVAQPFAQQMYSNSFVPQAPQMAFAFQNQIQQQSANISYGVFGAPPPPPPGCPPPPGGRAIFNSDPYDAYQFEQLQDNAQFDLFGGAQPDYYVEARRQFQQDFKNLEKTKEYGEKHYIKAAQLYESQLLVPFTWFWVEVAKHSIEHGIFNKPFLSQRFIFCNGNHTQMVAVLALMDLPFTSPNHKYTPYEGKGVQIELAANALIFTKEIKEGEANLRQDILVNQRFFDPNDRYVYQDDDPTVKMEKDVSEYIINKVYGGQIIVTNCTVTRFDFQVLVEVPGGSIPVETVDYTKNHNISLDPYTTKTIDYYFYFPHQGHFKVQPANVSRSGSVVAVAKSFEFTVNRELTKTNLETMDEILSKGSKEDILNFIRTKNIQNTSIFRFEDIYYLLKDRDFYFSLLDILRKKKVFDFVVWSFAFYHKDHQVLKEFFASESSRSVFQNTPSIKYLKSTLLEYKDIRFTEYYPLVSQRVHQLSQDTSNILNIEFKQQYIFFIQYLVQKQKHDLKDKLVFIYYLLLQERINEAIQVYKSIDQTQLPESGEALLQFDYFTAYLDFYIGFPHFQRARAVCEKYLDCPAIHWRNLFYEIVNQLTEYDGEEVSDQVKQKIQTDKKTKTNLEGAEKEEVLNLTLEGQTIILAHTNLQKVTIQIYKIDLEVLFSRNPFIGQGSEDFAFVQPNYVISQDLSFDAVTKQGTTTIEIPEEFKKHNIFIQVNGGEKRAFTTYFSTSLKVQVLENYGQIKVQDQNDKFLSKIYVKTFSKQKDGSVIFYKDGYTDLRGRLDYASLNADSLKNVEKFAIFVISDELGSLIKEVKAPSTVGKYDQEVKLISKAWEQKRNFTRQTQVQCYQANQEKFSKKAQR